MRIVVDLQSCQSGSHLGGIGRFSMSLLKAMIETHSEHDYLILLNDVFAERANAVRHELRNYLPPSNFLCFPSARGTAFANRRPQLTQAAELIREAFISGLSPDVVHVSSLVEGEREDIVTSIGALPGGAPTAVTFHDLIPMTSRDIYLRDPHTRSFYFEKIRHLVRADGLLANSQFVADEGRRILTDFKGTITTIGGGVASNFKKLASIEGLAGVKRKYGISRKFILYTSSFDQRKNQKALIEAFAVIPPEKRSGHVLVIAGDGSDYIYKQLKALARDVGLQSDDLIFTGRVSDEELVLLYNACDLFVFPSKLEGLGLPVLEAMACGVPVIGSGTSSLIEVLGSRELMFDPLDASDIAAKMERGLFDADFRTAAIEHGRDQVKKWTWEATARRAIGALDSLRTAGSQCAAASTVSDRVVPLVQGEDLIDSDLIQITSALADADMFFEGRHAPKDIHIGWVTTWGTRCGIATYANRLVEMSGFRATVFASHASNEVKQDAQTDVQVHRCWTKGKSDHLLQLLEAVQNASLDALHIQFNYGLFNLVALNDFIIRQIKRGQCVFITLHSTTDDPALDDSRLVNLCPALSLCSKIFVHSIHDVDRLARLGLTQNVVLIPHGIADMAPADHAETSHEPVIATYGFALPGKGLHEVVEAFSILRKQSLASRLLLVNADYGDAGGDSASLIRSLKELVTKLELDEFVEFHNDFLSDEQSLSLVSRADIVVYPYTRSGESGSGAVRLGLLSGSIVATTPLAIFDDVKEAVYQLPGTSVDQIASGLHGLVQKIREQDPELVKLRGRCSDLLNATRYSRVAAFMDLVCQQAIHKNGFVPVLQMSQATLPLLNGRWQSGGVAASGQGVVCHGPYEAMREGVYRIIVKGELSSTHGHATVNIKSGDELIARARLHSNADGVIGDFLFVLNNPCAAFEVVVDWDGGGFLLVRDYVVLRKC